MFTSPNGLWYIPIPKGIVPRLFRDCFIPKHAEEVVHEIVPAPIQKPIPVQIVPSKPFKLAPTCVWSVPLAQKTTNVPAPVQPIVEPAPVQPIVEPAPVQLIVEPAPVQPIVEPAPVQPIVEPAPVQPIVLDILPMLMESFKNECVFAQMDMMTKNPVQPIIQDSLPMLIESLKNDPAFARMDMMTKNPVQPIIQDSLTMLIETLQTKITEPVVLPQVIQPVLPQVIQPVLPQVNQPVLHQFVHPVEFDNPAFEIASIEICDWFIFDHKYHENDNVKWGDITDDDENLTDQEFAIQARTAFCDVCDKNFANAFNQFFGQQQVVC
jgi:hypothetical protein